jgi:hypothetical protein
MNIENILVASLFGIFLIVAIYMYAKQTFIQNYKYKSMGKWDYEG